MLLYWIWFAELPGSGWIKKELLQQFGDPETLFYAENLPENLSPELKEAIRKRDLSGTEKILQMCRYKHISVLTYEESEYPESLRQIDDPPFVLYFKGTLPNWQERPFIGIVGTRKATLYGLQMASRMGTQIGACGAGIVSGGASGIDSNAMWGGLDAGAKVVCVLGCGADVIYPRTNRKLFAAVEESGCILTEFAPEESPLPWHFPRRNRIISALSKGVLVVEAPEKSGALSTARHALNQGKDLYVVPGNVGVDACAGSNALLQEGAAAAICGWDAVKAYAGNYPETIRKDAPIAPLSQERKQAKVAQKPEIPEKLTEKGIDNPEYSSYSVLDNTPSGLSSEEQTVLALLTHHPKHTDEVCAQSQLPPARVQSILTKLTLKGLVCHHPGSRVSLK